MREDRRYMASIRRYSEPIVKDNWRKIPVRVRFEERIAEIKKILQKGPDKNLRETLELNEYLYNGLFYTKGRK